MALSELLSLDVKLCFSDLDFAALKRKSWRHPGSPSGANLDQLSKEIGETEVWIARRALTGTVDCHICAEGIGQARLILSELEKDIATK